MEVNTESEFDLESEDFNLDHIIDSAVDQASSPSVPNPKIEIPNLFSNKFTPSLELKALPKQLKYVYLGRRETLPVIIVSHLTEKQEENLMSILRKYRETIGWTMNDIKGISPTIVQHCIHLNGDATPTKDPQGRLNPLMQEAVKTEILKLSDNRIIYPISDSQWVSHIHTVPKKAAQ